MDHFEFWRDALAGKHPEISADHPQCGFYKMRKGRDGKWLPVMIRYDDAGALRARVADDSGVDPLAIWTWCAKHPVSKADAKIAFDMGSFPGEVETADVGHNSGDVSLSEVVRDYVETALTWLRKVGVKDKPTSDQAANYRSELLRLSKEADKQRDAEKRPHDEAAKAVQAKWKPVIDEATSAANAIRDELTKWMRAEEARLEAERRAKWEAEQKAAAEERARIEAERAKQMREDPIAALTSPEPEMPAPPIAPEPVKVQSGGQRGRKVGLREVSRFVVKDHAVALAFFAESQDVKELIQKLADRAGRAGVAVPGVEKVTEKVAA